MLNPLSTMLVLSIAFSRVFGSTVEGYAAYVLSGLIAWVFFSQTTTAAISHLLWGGGLMKRIYAPRAVFSLSAVGTGLVASRSPGSIREFCRGDRRLSYQPGWARRISWL
jgi:ABC-type polysaccharide/polyol phosphate export permease